MRGIQGKGMVEGETWERTTARVNKEREGVNNMSGDKCELMGETEGIMYGQAKW